MLNVTFHGVRASPRPAGEAASRYGEHGPCVALEVPQGDAILLDLGTGVSRWAATLDADRPVRASALLAAARPDRTAKLPSFDGEVFGPPPGPGAGGIGWVVVEDEDLAVGDAKVTVRPLAYAEPVNGYRVEWQGVTVACVSVLGTVPRGLRDLAEGADLLVLDTWGRSTVDDALGGAPEAGARIVALSGHAPDHADEQLDRMLAEAQRAGARLGLGEVLLAAEGTTLSFERGGR